MYNLHHLRTLREVHVRGTLAAAAAALGHNPSTVSHQLGALERDVGVRLLEPTGRTVRLSPAALALVEHTERILGELERAQASIAASRSGVTGLVRVATFQTAAHTVIPDAIAGLRRLHPQLRLRVDHVAAEQALPGLLANNYDIVLQEEYPGHALPRFTGIETTTIIDDPLLFATADRPDAPTRIGDVGALQWVFEPDGCLAQQWALATCRAAGIEPVIAFTTADLLLHLRLIASGAVVGLVPNLPIAVADVSGLRFARLGPYDARTISVAQRRGSARSPALTAVREAIARGLRRARDVALARVGI